MRSPVNWALLGLVIQRPSYGYELVQRFERTYGDSLELSSASQIYTALDTLMRRGLIEELPAPETEEVVRQPKPHYMATQHGHCSYERWLVSQLDDDRRRSRLFAQQFAVLGPAAALSVLDRCEQACLKEASSLPARAAQQGASAAGRRTRGARKGAAGADGAAGVDRAEGAAGADRTAGGEGAAGIVARLINEEDRLRVQAKLSWTQYARRELRALIARRGGE